MAILVPGRGLQIGGGSEGYIHFYWPPKANIIIIPYYK